MEVLERTLEKRISMPLVEAATVEQYDFHEVVLEGPSSGNPFVDVELSAVFKQGSEWIEVDGFYDGNGIYKIRFMPLKTGFWSYETRSNVPTLAGRTGALTCLEASPANHGMVRVANTFHFAYSDGTPYRQIGTTAYAWAHQGDALEQQTLDTLRNSPFNKIRMCVFPKRYAYNCNEPAHYPFEKLPTGEWDTERLNPEFFQHFEGLVAQLRDMNIEADVILFHPYDVGHWGFDRMDAAADDRYLKYLLARLSAYRNVWWSVANEFDFMKEKRPADWDRYFQIIVEHDPYDHLRSIHNGTLIYDHNKPWVTHASIQNGSAVEDAGRAIIYRDCYRKPVVFDEVKYEGNISQRWGELAPQEMTYRFWQGTIAGTYVGHGETYRHPDDVIWWARGGRLHGQSPERLKFLRRVMEEGPKAGIEPIDKWQDHRTAGQPGEFYLVYFGHEAPTEWLFELPRQGLSAGMQFTAEILDTWNMTVTPVEGVFKVICDTTYRYHAEGMPKIQLPGNKWLAIRLKRLADGVVYRNGQHIYGEA